MRRTLFFVSALFFVITMLGCQHRFSIAQPAPPPIDPSVYSKDDYEDDLDTYRDALAANPPDVEKAMQVRNEIGYALMGQIDVVYSEYYDRLFTTKGSVAVTGDVLALGLSAGSTIAANSATKTILSALGTAVTGVSLSVDKNFFAQQTFPVIGLAMQNRRDTVRNGIIKNLSLDTRSYPLQALKRDLVAYLYAGTLPGGLQELQAEAGKAAAQQTAIATTPSVPQGLKPVAGDSEVTLMWSPVNGATAYNAYYSEKQGANTSTATKGWTGTANTATIKDLKNSQPYYFFVTSVSGNTESEPSNEVSATPGRPSSGFGPPTLSVVAGDAQNTLVWSPVRDAKSYKLYWATSAEGLRTSKPIEVTGTSYMHTGLDAKPYFYQITAVNGNDEESARSEIKSATPLPKFMPEQMRVLTPH